MTGLETNYHPLSANRPNLAPWQEIVDRRPRLIDNYPSTGSVKCQALFQVGANAAFVLHYIG